ncbi:MAG: histidine kinase [Clostridiales bacterium]|nr:histidine kinase [Clostridiales bacterium]
MSRRKGMRLQSRLGVVFLLVIFVPTLVAVFLFSESVSRLSAQRLDETNIQISRQRAATLSALLQDITTYSSMLVGAQEVRASLWQDEYDAAAYYYVYRELQKVVGYIPYQLSGLDITLMSGNGYVYSTLPHSSMSAQGMLGSEWYAEAVRNQSEYSWFATDEPYERAGARLDSRVCLARAVTDSLTGRVGGVLLITIPQGQLLSYIGAGGAGGTGGAGGASGTGGAGAQESVAVFDASGRLLASAGGGAAEAAYAFAAGKDGQVVEAAIDGERTRIYIQRGAFRGLLLLQALPDSAATAGLPGLHARQIVFSILSDLVFCLLAFRLLRGFLAPMDSIARAMRRVEGGDLSAGVELPARASPEFVELGERFSEMTRNLSRLLGDNEASRRRIGEEERQKLEYRYNMLLSQVQPHFLFNTLSDIKWLCALHGDAKGAGAVSALGRILEASIGKQSEIVALRDELGNLGAYTRLLRIRYADRFTFDYDVPDGLLGAQVLRMTLQPLVENAVRHGLQPRPGGGRIEVRAFAEGDLLTLTVRDDGVGIDPARMEALFRSAEDGAGGSLSRIGLIGTHERIRHTFGRDYGISLANAAPWGAIATVRLPLRRAAEGEAGNTGTASSAAGATDAGAGEGAGMGEAGAVVGGAAEATGASAGEGAAKDETGAVAGDTCAGETGAVAGGLAHAGADESLEAGHNR